MKSIDFDAPQSQFEKSAGALSIALLVILFVYTARNFLQLPDTVPTHLNMNGEIDGWGSRWFIWFLPFTAVFTFVLLLLPGKFPHSINYPVKITEANAQDQFLIARQFIKILRLAMMLMFVFLQFVIVSLAQNAELPFHIGVLVPVLVAIVFLPIVFYLYRAFRAQ